jgi:hypothetical protein
MPASTSSAAKLHADGVAAFSAGETDRAIDLLRRAALDGVEASVLNDLAVVLAQQGDREDALSLLRACLALDPTDDTTRANLTDLDAVEAAGDVAAWRASQTLGGPDPKMPERAFPGMPGKSTMAEHAMRYSLAMGMVGNCDTLDIGCGTGYGSEMLTWVAKSVRGFDLWEPEPHERPRWGGGAELHYGHDICAQPLPRADVGVMFEITEHLHDAPAALRNVFAAVPALIVSFPNPVYNGSHLNHHHVNDWPLEQFEQELQRAASHRYAALRMSHFHQPKDTPLIVPGRDAEAPFWIVVAIADRRR